MPTQADIDHALKHLNAVDADAQAALKQIVSRAIALTNGLAIDGEDYYTALIAATGNGAADRRIRDFLTAVIAAGGSLNHSKVIHEAWQDGRDVDGILP